MLLATHYMVAMVRSAQSASAHVTHVVTLFTGVHFSKSNPEMILVLYKQLANLCCLLLQGQHCSEDYVFISHDLVLVSLPCYAENLSFHVVIQAHIDSICHTFDQPFDVEDKT